MVVSTSSDPYSPFHPAIMSEDGPQSSEDSSGLHSPLFAPDHYPAHGNNLFPLSFSLTDFHPSPVYAGPWSATFCSIGCIAISLWSQYACPTATDAWQFARTSEPKRPCFFFVPLHWPNPQPTRHWLPTPFPSQLQDSLFTRNLVIGLQIHLALWQAAARCSHSRSFVSPSYRTPFWVTCR